MSDAISKALKTAFELGKTYWMQADSQSFAEQRRSDETLAQFRALEARTLQALQSGEPVASVGSLNEFDAMRLVRDGYALTDPLYTTPQHVGFSHPDDLAVDRFASAMRAKMAKSRAKGRSGWENPLQCSGHDLAAMLVQHVEKGDPVDVANFCMMLHQRGIAGHEIHTALSDYVNAHTPQPVVPEGDIMPLVWMRPEDAARTMIAIECERAEVAPDKEPGFTVPLYRCPPPTVSRDDLIQLLIATRAQSEGVTADLIIKLLSAGKETA